MVISVRVQTRSGKKKLERVGANEYKAYLNAPPENNKANKELIGVVSKSFGVKKYQVEILRGLTSRNKLVKIDMDS